MKKFVSQSSLTARQQMQRHQLPKRQAYLKAQQRLEVVAGYLENIRSMLDESAIQLAGYHYPIDRLRWVVDVGLPTMQEKIQREYDELSVSFAQEFIPPKLESSR